MSRQQFRSIEEALENFYSDKIEEDLAALPPDVDELTDEETIDDENLEAPFIQDIAGNIEVIIPEVEGENDIPTAFSPQELKTKKKKFDNLNITWEKKIPEYTKLPEAGNSFFRLIELVKTDLANATPLEIFEKFFTEEIFDFMVEETIRYATTQKNMHDLSLSTQDIKIFLGFLVLSGYHTLPSERDYWREEEDLGLDVVRNAFSRNAYCTIKYLIHFQDNSKAEDNKHDKSFKVNPLIDKINDKFQQYGIFEKYLSIDEMIVRYYGHNPLKQFIRSKPIRFGYKLWALCGESGYCYKFSLYCGKEPLETSSVGPLGSKVVMSLLSAVEDPSSHVVIFDNFFTSHSLLIELREKGFRATGRICDNRTAKCPIKSTKEIEKSVRGSYDYRFDTSNEILVLRWNDNRSVTLATNYDTVEPISSALQWSREAKERLPIPQPLLIKSYNKYMGGVDHHDWLLEKHGIAIRGKKWYWCLVTRVIDMTIVNAFILYRLIHGSKSISIKDFRRSIAVKYLKLGHGQNVMKGRPYSFPSTSKPAVSEDIRFDREDHIIGKREKQRRCQFRGCKGKPLTCCTKYDVTLCTRCFPKFHNKKESSKPN